MRCCAIKQIDCDFPWSQKFAEIRRVDGHAARCADNVLESFFPPASTAGCPRKWPLRWIFEAILYLLRRGLPWRMLAPCFPPVSTVRHRFYLRRDNRLWLSLNHALLLIGRDAVGREALPSAGVIDSQSVKAMESGGSRGYDAGKKTKGPQASHPDRNRRQSRPCGRPHR